MISLNNIGMETNYIATLRYKQLYAKFTKNLSDKTRDVFERRFGVKAGVPETLESIGKSYKITRERVRQIEEAGFNSIRKMHGAVLDQVFAEFADYFSKQGGFKREEDILQDLGGKTQKPYVLFLLTLGGERFSRTAEKKDFHYFWSNTDNAQSKIKETLSALASEMQKVGKPMAKAEFASIASKLGLSTQAIESYLGVSKRIQQDKEGNFGLDTWPEIKPRGVKDKSYLVFKKHGKPLHFTEVAKLIDKLEYNLPNKKTYAQTVHNELIKDSRFVLVGRGTYALAEWGYYPGTIKEVIAKVLEGQKAPVHKDEIVKQVLAQRLVAKNTVLMNLNNKKDFGKDGSERYFLRKTQTA